MDLDKYEICNIEEDIDNVKKKKEDLYFWPPTFAQPIRYSSYGEARKDFKKGKTVLFERK